MRLFRAPAAAAVVTSGTTWDPANKGPDVTLSGGNLIADQTSGFDWVRGTTSKTTGKWYFEVLINNSGGGISHQGIAVVDGSASPSGAFSTGSCFLCDLGVLGSGSGGTAPSTTIVDGTVLQCCLDADNHLVWFGNNNTFGGSPSAGTGGYSFSTGPYWPATGEQQGKSTGRFLAASQSFSPPSGFTAWG
jgi:hypothetical protein